jgi:hypothetical protein
MELPPPRCRQPFGQDLLIEGVEEAVAFGQPPLGSGRSLGRAQEQEQVPCRRARASQQPSISTTSVSRTAATQAAENSLPGHTGRLKHPSLLFAQPIELINDELAQDLRQLSG